MLKIAAFLAGLTALVHLAIGTLDTLYPSLSGTAALAATGPVVASWYILGLVFCWSSWVFWKKSDATPSLGLLWVLGGLIFVALAFAGEGLSGLITLPQWSLLLPTGLLAILGYRQVLKHPKRLPSFE